MKLLPEVCRGPMIQWVNDPLIWIQDPDFDTDSDLFSKICVNHFAKQDSVASGAMCRVAEICSL